jgi:hypothetical protein
LFWQFDALIFALVAGVQRRSWEIFIKVVDFSEITTFCWFAKSVNSTNEFRALLELLEFSFKSSLRTTFAVRNLLE